MSLNSTPDEILARLQREEKACADYLKRSLSYFIDNNLHDQSILSLFNWNRSHFDSHIWPNFTRTEERLNMTYSSRMKLFNSDVTSEQITSAQNDMRQACQDVKAFAELTGYSNIQRLECS